ncbi:hypothetical protein MRX96_044725 [Rhipicephalus microplus]
MRSTDKAGSVKTGSVAGLSVPGKSIAQEETRKTRKPSQQINTRHDSVPRGGVSGSTRIDPEGAPVQQVQQHNETRLWVAVGVFMAVAMTCIAVYLVILRKPRIQLEKCRSTPCLEHAKRLLASLNSSVNPCNDFYAFTCGRWQNSSTEKSVQDVMNKKAMQEEIQEVSTDLWQQGRASRLYHDCLSPEPSHIETDLVALKDTMKDLLLTWPMEEPQPTDAHPLGVMVEMALKWDINFVFGLEASRTKSMGKILVIRKAYSRAAWVDRFEKSTSPEDYERIVSAHLFYVGANLTNTNSTLLQELEYSFMAAKFRKARGAQKWIILAKISDETPSFDSASWLQHLWRHSEDSGSKWSSHDMVQLEDAHILADVEGLFMKHTHVELLIGIAWMFLQSHLWAVVGKPELMFHDNVEDKKKHACLEYVDSRFGLLSSVSHLLKLYPTNEARREVLDFLLSLKSEFETLIKNSSWIDGQSKHTAGQKIAAMMLTILPAERFFAAQQRAVLYERFPSMNSSGFFEGWLQASVTYQKLHGDERYRDVYKKRRTLLYEPYSYSYLENYVSAATVSLEPPMFYERAPLMINYGGAGVQVARQIAKSFDPRGVNVDDRGETISWWGKQQSGEYSSRVTCRLGEGAPASMGVLPTIPAIEAAFLRLPGRSVQIAGPPWVRCGPQNSGPRKVQR